jgi:hypothetical protein
MREIISSLAILSIVLLASCSNHSNTTGNAPSNTIIATYNGQTVALPLQHTVGLYPGQAVQIITTAFPDIDINLGSITDPNFASGTYNFCSTNCVNGTNDMTLSDNTGLSYSSFNGGNGSVTINFSNNVATGTFTATLIGGSNGTTSLPISGSFNVSY